MKKIIATSLILIAAPLMFLKVASAQFVSTADDSLSQVTTEVATAANLGNVSIGILIARIIRIVLSLLAIIFLVLTIVAGFRWMTAAGNEEAVKKAQATIKMAVIGLVIILAAYSITYFVFKYLPFSGGTSVQGGTSG